MKIYRVEFHTAQEGSEGFSFHASKAEASKALTKFLKEESEPEHQPKAEIEVIEFTPTRAGIIAMLTQYAAHADNG